MSSESGRMLAKWMYAAAAGACVYTAMAFYVGSGFSCFVFSKGGTGFSCFVFDLDKDGKPDKEKTCVPHVNPSITDGEIKLDKGYVGSDPMALTAPGEITAVADSPYIKFNYDSGLNVMAEDDLSKETFYIQGDTKFPDAMTATVGEIREALKAMRAKK